MLVFFVVTNSINVPENKMALNNLNVVQHNSLHVGHISVVQLPVSSLLRQNQVEKNGFKKNP